MNEDQLVSAFALAFGTAAVGAIFGLAYFEALRRTVDSLAAGRGWLRVITLVLTRLACAALLFAFMARLGVIAPIAGLTGFLAARMIAVRRVHGAG